MSTHAITVRYSTSASDAVTVAPWLRGLHDVVTYQTAKGPLRLHLLWDLDQYGVVTLSEDSANQLYRRGLVHPPLPAVKVNHNWRGAKPDRIPYVRKVAPTVKPKRHEVPAYDPYEAVRLFKEVHGLDGA